MHSKIGSVIRLATGEPNLGKDANMKDLHTILPLIVCAVSLRQPVHAQSTSLPVIPPPAAASKGAPSNLPNAVPETQAAFSSSDPVLAPDPGFEPLPLGESSESANITLDELEQLARVNNPSLAQAEARIRALRGSWVQAGLPPNPSVGYLASEIGDDDRAGQQGGYVGQEFITGGKLQLNRAVVAQEIQRAEQQWAAMQLRVQTDVRRAYYSALVAQRRADLSTELVRVSGEAVSASRELIEAEEIPQAGLLQTEVEQQNAVILSMTANNELQAAWRQLSSVVGVEMPMRRLEGNVTELPALLNWEEQLARVTTASPEVAAAVSNLARAQMALRRARAEPIPDIITQFSVQFDNATEDTIAGVQVGMPLPIWNRNQGGIRQAEAEITQARRNADRVELDLKRRLAIAFQTYSSARAQADTYKTQILPKADETFRIVQRGYRLGELGYLDLLTAQRTYSQTNLSYLGALEALWRSWAEIDGLLLSESLATPPE
jgi:cobalt-zinc-cadmium efflux system outer membrane protein